ncbi:MAG: RlmE family RNA methyltransferase [Methanomassiliicoccaceae archaeon]|jgi:23S rRNA (uridine2552-2'-O)-methyltransferase|nr:RlmE family RNA methyltransferase [Methanomassiliicoccaceae archaeon]
MTGRWLSEHKQEKYYRLAKKLDYRSRASFKLIQMDDRFGIFTEGDSVVDLGASPGGWLQVAKERVGDGKVIGVDLRPIRPIDGVMTIRGDITVKETMDALYEKFGGKADIVLSDMAPNVGGHYSTDHARSVHLCTYAIDVADHILKKNGKMIMKVFMGDLFPQLKEEMDKRFRDVKIHSPDATRSTSSEVYLVAMGFKGHRPKKLRSEDAEEKKKEFTVKGELK